MKKSWVHRSIVACLMVLSLASCQPSTSSTNALLTDPARTSESDGTSPQGTWKSLADVATGRIAVLTGAIHDGYAARAMPGAKVMHLNSFADLTLAVRTGKVDVALVDGVSARQVVRNDPALAVLSDDFFDTPLGVGFRKDQQDLRQRFNRFIDGLAADGTLAAMEQRWLIGDPEQAVMPEIVAPHHGGKLIVGIAPVVSLPYVAATDRGMVGFDIELLQRFGVHEGIELVFVSLEFDALISALTAGKVDLIGSAISITEERSRLIDFSKPYTQSKSAALVLAKNLAAGSRRDAPAPDGWESLDDLATGRIAVVMGTIFDGFVARTYPGAEIVRLRSTSDAVASLRIGHVDAALMPDSTARLVLKANPDLAVLDDNILEIDLGIGFRKGDAALRERFNRFLREIRADGTYDAVAQRWLLEDPETALMPAVPIPTEGQPIRLGVAVGDLPYVAVVDGQYVGFDIEILRRFAARESLILTIIPFEFDALVAALAAGKVDMIADGIAITEERSRLVDFSAPYTSLRTMAVARKAAIAGAAEEQEGVPRTPSAGFVASLGASIERTLITERRWVLILEGVQITVVLSILATLFGTLLGALVCAMRMSGQVLLRGTAKVFIEVVRGIPVLVLLMLIFYVAFGSVNIDPLIVAVIAFGVNFAAYVSEMFRTGIESIGRGQREAGIAMGFTRIQTFLHVILPQAVRRILPVYRGEFMSLVKMTAIVGYIGIQDLTRAGDIIRSRTFEAFFPMILIAVIYFAVIWVLGLALDHVDRRTDPKTRRAARIRT